MMTEEISDSFSCLWGQVTVAAGALDLQSEKVGLNLTCARKARRFIILASSVDRDVNGGPIG